MDRYSSPVYNVRAVPVEKVSANNYNPNVVAPPEMQLLELSIWEDGYTMPCVCYHIPNSFRAFPVVVEAISPTSLPVSSASLAAM